MKRLVFLALFLSQQAVADGYEKFYKSYPDVNPSLVAKMRAAPPLATPELAEFSDSPQAILDAYTRRGYGAIGYSSFNSGWAAKSKGALKQGKRVQADLVVVINPTLTSSVTNSFPITTPTTQTTYHRGQATAYGAGGTVSAYGTGTSTTHGTQTTYIPYTVNRYEYGAIFFVKLKVRFGANGRSLNNEERQSMQTNSGFFVIDTIEGSPAFLADILPGDIILKLNGEPDTGLERHRELVVQFAGQRVEVLIRRKDETLTKSVLILP